MSDTRHGYTLMELLAATASASVLMVGLSSALFVSSQALRVDESPMASRMQSGMGMERLLADVQTALKFNVRTTTAIEFTTPDITGDGSIDTLRYEWSGKAGDPLLRQINGGELLTVMPDVQSLNFRYMDRDVIATDITVPPNPTWPILESIAVENAAGNATSIVVPAPTGVEEGDLLIGCIAIRDDVKDTLTPPSGWSEIALNQEDGKVTLGVWWKNARASEPSSYTWTWAQSKQPIALVMRISNQYDGNPVTTFATDNGKSQTPGCPAASTTLDDSMALRIGGFHNDEVDPDAPGVAGHTPVYMDAGSDKVSLGTAYKIVAFAGDAGDAEFELNKSEEYCTLTLVIAPKQQD